MRFRCSNHLTVLTDEQGIYLVLTAFLLIVMFAVGGLAVDSGYAYRTKGYLQNALDLGAIRGAYLLQEGATIPTVSALARSLVIENVRAAGIDQVNITDLIVTIPEERDRISITGAIRQDTLLVRIVPGLPRVVDIAAASEAVLGPVAVSMVLDISGSMDKCIPRTVSPCTTEFPSRLTALKTAAGHFIDKLGAGDYIGLARFAGSGSNVGINYPIGVEAEILEPMTVLQGGAEEILLQRIALKTIINSQVIDWAYPMTNSEDGLYIGRKILEDSTVPDEARRLLVVITDGSPNTTEPAPDLSAEFGAACEARIDGEDSSERKKKFLLTIRQADLARSLGQTIYTIGTGEEDIDTSSPYQDIFSADWQITKRFFLQRLANDQNGMRFPGPLPVWVAPPVPYFYDFESECVPTGMSIADETGGRYLFADDLAALEQALTLVAQQKVRLTR